MGNFQKNSPHPSTAVRIFETYAVLGFDPPISGLLRVSDMIGSIKQLLPILAGVTSTNHTSVNCIEQNLIGALVVGHIMELEDKEPNKYRHEKTYTTQHSE